MPLVLELSPVSFATSLPPSVGGQRGPSGCPSPYPPNVLFTHRNSDLAIRNLRHLGIGHKPACKVGGLSRVLDSLFHPSH